jgi:protein phosphatase
LTTRVGYRSVTGNNRSNNEDRCYVDARHNVFLVADGIGGYLGGEQASQIVMETAPAELLKALRSGAAAPSDVHGALRQAILAAQQAIAAYAQDRPLYHKMGSTVLLAVLIHDTLHLGHVGDGRAYVIRAGKIRQLTTDQTYVQLLVASGAISPGEARTHPLRSILLNSLSTNPMEEEPEIRSELLQPADRVLLATDGLTDVVDDETLRVTIAAEQNPQAAADRLVRKALENHSKDNVTCVVVELAAAHRRASEAEPGRDSVLTRPCLE